MTKLSYEDVTRIQSIILSSNYPDDLVERYVDGIESMYEKARVFDYIKEKRNWASDSEEYANMVERKIEELEREE